MENVAGLVMTPVCWGLNLLWTKSSWKHKDRQLLSAFMGLQ